jgi:hypothetical protein
MNIYRIGDAIMEESMVFNPKLKTTEVKYEKAYLYGQYFHVVTLKDGRDIGLSADKVVVTDNGDLIAISNSHYDETKNERATLPVSKTVLALSRGEWISFYSASAVNGDPLGIEWFDKIPNLD